MRYAYMSKRGGNHENYDANGMWHGMKTYNYQVQTNVHMVYHIHKIRHQLDMKSMENYTKWNQLNMTTWLKVRMWQIQNSIKHHKCIFITFKDMTMEQSDEQYKLQCTRILLCKACNLQSD